MLSLPYRTQLQLWCDQMQCYSPSCPQKCCHCAACPTSTFSANGSGDCTPLCPMLELEMPQLPTRLLCLTRRVSRSFLLLRLFVMRSSNGSAAAWMKSHLGPMPVYPLRALHWQLIGIGLKVVLGTERRRQLVGQKAPRRPCFTSITL